MKGLVVLIVVVIFTVGCVYEFSKIATKANYDAASEVILSGELVDSFVE